MKNENLKNWLKPFGFLAALSLLIFYLNRFIDKILVENNIIFFEGFLGSDFAQLADTVGGLTEAAIAIVAVEITVIAIVLQLASNKYSNKVVDLFIENKINFYVLTLFVITAANTLLITHTFIEEIPARFSIFFNLFLATLSVLVVLPHFNYVFNFLRPNNFIGQVKNNTDEIFKDLAEGKIKYSDAVKDRVNNNINFIGDIALNSVYQGDRAITLLCITTLRELTVKYLHFKKNLPKDWFRLTGMEYFDPDFSSFSPYVMEKIEKRKILLERKIFKLFELLFNASRLNLRDVASGVLLNSELIAFAAANEKDRETLNTTFQYFNSYLRIAISGKDPRSAFNALEHYRIIAEELLNEYPDEVEKLAFYFKYYGHEANKNQVLFILETAAHDLCRINELAYTKKVPNLEAILDIFLTVDQPIEEEKSATTQEISLIGVRIAQVKLAAFYLINNDEVLARRIFEDMKNEPIGRINKIKEIIENTKQEEFWEITPRGINFYYLSDKRKNALKTFFEWFK